MQRYIFKICNNSSNNNYMQNNLLRSINKPLNNKCTNNSINKCNHNNNNTQSKILTCKLLIKYISNNKIVCNYNSNFSIYSKILNKNNNSLHLKII